jgi:hypothetical protein
MTEVSKHLLIEDEITPEMVAAGVAALCINQDEIAHRPESILASTVIEVYEAMMRLRIESNGR